jgi:starch synthase (maltosyl-transferring)
MREGHNRVLTVGRRTGPGNQYPANGLYIYVRNSYPHETGRRFHVSDITVNKTTQTIESAAAGGAFHIEDVYPLVDGGRFPVKRIVGERIDVWADIYRDGHDVVAVALVWRLETH